MKIYKKLFAYVQDKKYLGVLAIIFSAISALLTVYGYYLIYKFLDKLIINSNLSGAESIALKSVITLTSGAIFYFVSGMFSHILGFRLETNLRKRGIDGLEKASFRFFDLNPSGQIRKIIDDNAAQTHQVVAHMIPDSSQAIITPVLVLALGFIVSIRVGIILLALTIIGGLILGAMMGEQEFMKIYQESLSKLSAETVEYVRGMQVVKIFKANVESFKSFYKAIKDYSKYAYDYSLSCKRPYVLYQWLFFGLIAILIIPIVYFMTSLASAKVILLELIMILFLSGVLFVSFMRMMWYSMYISQGNYAVDTLEALYEDMQKDKLVHGNVNNFKNYNPQLFTPNLKTIQNPCLSLDPGWFLFSPNGCFLLDKKEFPLYGISVEKNTKRKETHMNSLPNHHFQNKSFYQLSFDGGHLTQYGGLIFFQELFSQLKLKERISKYLVTNDQRRYCRYSDSDILVQFLFQLLTGYGTDYACKELSADAYFPKLLEGGQLASQPTLSRFLSRTDEETVHSLRCLNLELVEFFLQFHQLNQLIVDIDSTHFTTYGKQEGVAYNAHYRAHGYHPLYAFEGKTGYCFNAQLRPGNRYCSEEADSFITPVLERFNQLLFRMDSGFATPKLYDLIEKTGQYYLIKLKKNTVLSRLGDLSLPCPQDEDLTILPHSAYSETLYQAGSWSHKRRVCQFSERKEGNLFYDVISLVTNMTSGTSQDQFQLYRGRGQAENFIKEMKEGFFGDKTDSSTLIKNEVRMMMSCIAYNLYLFLKHLAGGDFQTLTIKRFRHLFLHVVGKCVRTGRKQLLKLSSLYAYSELFSALYSRIRKVNLNLPVPYEPPRRKASLMMH